MEKKIVAAILAVGEFFIVGIVLNVVLIQEIYSCNAAEAHLWSQNGAGAVYAVIAGIAGIIAKKLFDKLSIEE